MFITKKHLSRRTFLRGLGAAVGLPLLDAMIPARTALAQTAAAPKPRWDSSIFPHGAMMDHGRRRRTGTAFELPPILKPLEPFKKQLTIVSGLENKPTAIAPPVHALHPGTWLSCVARARRQDPIGGVTIDQIAAQHIGQDTPLPSLEVATEGRGGRRRLRPQLRLQLCAAPSRSARLPRRCRWKRTRASSSSGCSGRAIRRRSARRSSRQYSSILDW